MPTKENAKRVSKIFGRVLAEARSQGGVTQQALAEGAGVDPVFISYLENGHRQPTLTVLLAIEKTLNLPDGELAVRTAKALRHR